jgi:hypothetical protein
MSVLAERYDVTCSASAHQEGRCNPGRLFPRVGQPVVNRQS